MGATKPVTDEAFEAEVWQSTKASALRRERPVSGLRNAIGA